MSEQSMRARLKAVYGDEVSQVVDVAAGANVVVFRKREPG